jgi:hypothetical protein
MSENNSELIDDIKLFEKMKLSMSIFSNEINEINVNNKNKIKNLSCVNKKWFVSDINSIYNTVNNIIKCGCNYCDFIEKNISPCICLNGNILYSLIEKYHVEKILFVNEIYPIDDLKINIKTTKFYCFPFIFSTDYYENLSKKYYLPTKNIIDNCSFQLSTKNYPYMFGSDNIYDINFIRISKSSYDIFEYITKNPELNEIKFIHYYIVSVEISEILDKSDK